MSVIQAKVRGNVDLYSASKALRHGSHSFTCKLHHACLYLVSIHQMALPLTCDNVRLIAAYYSFIDTVMYNVLSSLATCGRLGAATVAAA